MKCDITCVFRREVKKIGSDMRPDETITRKAETDKESQRQKVTTSPISQKICAVSSPNEPHRAEQHRKVSDNSLCQLLPCVICHVMSSIALCHLLPFVLCHLLLCLICCIVLSVALCHLLPCVLTRFNKICHPSQRPRWQVDKETIGLSRVQQCSSTYSLPS